MLEKLTVRNFKKCEEAEIHLGSPVVFIGPNNSGKTEEYFDKLLPNFPPMINPYTGKHMAQTDLI